MIKVQEISFGYERTRLILEKISFSVKSGESVAILGNNGAGKSTMLKCLNRILTPQQGRVLVTGKDICRMSLAEVAKNMAFVEQHAPDSRLTVHEMIMLGRKPYIKWGVRREDEQIVAQIIQKMDLQKIELRFFEELSGGEKQKVMLARALAQQPKSLLLDEPTSSLDLRNQYEVLELVSEICRQKEIAVVLVIHDINLALRYCDKFLLMKENQVYAYGGEDIINEETMTAVYGIKIKVRQIDGEKFIIPCARPSNPSTFRQLA